MANWHNNRNLYHLVKSKKTLSILILIILIAAIPTTVILVRKIADIRQRAASTPAVVSINPTTTNPGDTVVVGWTIDQQTARATGGETLQLWKTTNEVVGSPLYLNCTPNTSPQPLYIGQCKYTIPKDTTKGNYIIRLLAADGSTILGQSPILTIGGESIPVIQFSAWPNPCLLTDYGTCSSIISWNVPGVANAGDVVVRVKGDGVTQNLFANAPYGTKKAGWITASGATFELYIGDATTPIASLVVKGIETFPTAVPQKPTATMTPSPTPTIVTPTPTRTPTPLPSR